MKGAEEARAASILVVDDDPGLASTLQEFLRREGYAVQVALSGAEALAIQAAHPGIPLALVDLIMPLMDGLALGDELRRRNPDIAVVIMTGYGTIETAVEAIKRGAEDYLTKPFDYEAVRKKISRLVEVIELRERVAQLERNLELHPCFENIASLSPAMERVLDRARVAAGSDASVLILGERGTGKEMLARAIHESSARARMPFVPIGGAAPPHELAAASGGTVFLDEIGEMPKDVQANLVRVLREGVSPPAGSAKPAPVDVRIVAAADRSLNELRSHLLREDLYFRIATVVLEVPPLRSRPEDILILARHFAARAAHRYGREIALGRAAVELLLRYPFPGNVRELENLVESAAAVSAEDPQTITEKDLRPLLAAPAPALISLNEPLSMERMEKLTIQQALRAARGNRSKAASLLGISRDTLYRKLRQYQF